MASIYGLTPDDLLERLDEQRLIELSDSEVTPTGSRDDVVIETKIEDAEAEFEQYAGRLYTLPVSPLPAGARKRIVDLAAYNLMTRKPENLEDEKGYWPRLRKELTAWLQGIASGAISLPGVSIEPPASSASSGSAEMSSDDATFTTDTMKGFF